MYFINKTLLRGIKKKKTGTEENRFIEQFISG